MFRKCSLRVAAFGALIVLFLSPVTAHTQSAAPSTRKQTTGVTKKESPADPKAIAIMKAVSNRLATMQTLSFVAVDTFERGGAQGTPPVNTIRSEVTLQRPDKLRVMLSGDGPPSQFYCNRNTTMTYSPAEKALVIAKAPPTINQCLKDAFKESAIYFPFVDLIASDLAPGMTHAAYVGRSRVGATNTDIVRYSGDNVSVEMWVGVEDRLPRLIQAVSLDDPNRLRHNVVLSDWKIDVPLRPDIFTSLKPDGPERLDSAEPHPVGTSGMQRPAEVRPLAIHTFGAKYWGASTPSDFVAPYNNYYGSPHTNYYSGPVQTTGYGAATYYHSPDGWGYYPPAYYGYYPPATAPYPGAYPGAQCVDCVSGWPTEGASVDTSGASFDISLSTSGWYDAGVAPDYNLAPGTSMPGQPTYVPGQIVTRLPVGCAAPYTRGAAFYLCGDTWFSGVYGSGGELYYRVISVPGY